MSKAMVVEEPAWRCERKPWGRADLVALGIWTAAIVAYFWKAVSLQEALFYFDITEINYPYREFFARELKAGRFSRWHPGLYCGMPLYCESQAGYLHPFKYLFYPWMATWKAFNLDTVLSVWLAGAGAYGWLRRHVGPPAALTGAAAFGIGGYMWAHIIHTSMINAMASVPLIVWALESAWEGARIRPMVLGALAMASQVFAGHLQDTILTAGGVVFYALYRASTERGWVPRLTTLGLAAGLIGLALLVSAIQWIPSKELLDRSPRARGLSWDDLTFGSWHPELLPTLIVREAYGTRARDTDWMDGYYPYHEMNAYHGLVALALAIAGAAAYRDRWVAFWIILAGVGSVLMLGRFTFVLDSGHLVPVAGSSRIPVRFHLWVSMAVAALAAVGVDRLSRPGSVRLRPALVTLGVLIAASIPILIYVYAPVWTEPQRWSLPYHQARFRWLGRELLIASGRTIVVAGVGWALASGAARATDPRRRARLAGLLPLVVIADLLGSHIADVPTISPTYWTEPPVSARLVKEDPGHFRVFGLAEKSAGEPGYGSEPVDFNAVRDRLAWGLPPLWGLDSATGVTPLISLRKFFFMFNTPPHQGRFNIEGVTHFLAGRELRDTLGPGIPAGSAFIYRNHDALPRVRLVGGPFIYVDSEKTAAGYIQELRGDFSRYLVVEDPDVPLPNDAVAKGTAAVVAEVPERVEVAVDAETPAYLVMSDTYDPGWSATLDGRPVPIRPAWVSYRAVFVTPGRHTLVFTYSPAGFGLGRLLTFIGLAIAVVGLCWPRGRLPLPLRAEHDDLAWPRAWPRWGLGLIAIILLFSLVDANHNSPTGLVFQQRWSRSFHRFTWGAGIESMREREPPPATRGS